MKSSTELIIYTVLNKSIFFIFPSLLLKIVVRARIFTFLWLAKLSKFIPHLFQYRKIISLFLEY